MILMKKKLVDLKIEMELLKEMMGDKMMMRMKMIMKEKMMLMMLLIMMNFDQLLDQHLKYQRQDQGRISRYHRATMRLETIRQEKLLDQ